MPPRPVATAVCPCGSSWFRIVPYDIEREGEPEHGAGAVSIDGNGMIIAMSGAYQCLECDTLVVLPQLVPITSTHPSGWKGAKQVPSRFPAHLSLVE